MSTLLPNWKGFIFHMRLTIVKLVITFLGMVPLISACAQPASDPAATIESYVQAIIAQEQDALVNLSCATWEEGARIDGNAFSGVTARLEGLGCEISGTEGDYTIVSCRGTIIATYQGEDRPIDLSARAYLALQEGGVWRMCGYR